MRLAEKKVMVPNLNEKQANLRFQLFDWLKSQNLSAEEAIALLISPHMKLIMQHLVKNFNQVHYSFPQSLP